MNSNTNCGTAQTVKPFNIFALEAGIKWICDIDLTPYIVVDTNGCKIETNIPMEFTNENGEITLNVSASAVREFKINTDSQTLQFSSRFHGVAHFLTIPIENIMGVFAKEDPEYSIVLFDPAERITEAAIPQRVTVVAPDGDLVDMSLTKDQIDAVRTAAETHGLIKPVREIADGAKSLSTDTGAVFGGATVVNLADFRARRNESKPK